MEEQRELISPMGRPLVQQQEILLQDQHFSEQVILILQAILQYTHEAGLRRGFFINMDPRNVSPQVFFEENLKPEDEFWICNTIVRIRYAMATKAAAEFQKIVKETYQVLCIRINVSVRALVGYLMEIINSNQNQYQFLLLTHPQLRTQQSQIAFERENLVTLLTQIVLSVRQSLIENGSMQTEMVPE